MSYPPILEAYITVIRLCNIVPTTNTGTLTPYEIFTKEKPKIPTYAFGTLAVAHHPRSDDKSIREEIRIFFLVPDDYKDGWESLG